MKVLVTGGSGYLGNHVCKYFEATDFSRRSNYDILNLQDVSVVEDYDVVIHLAAKLDKSPESVEEVFLINVEGTVNLLRSMRSDAVFIFASTKDVYGKNADNYDEVPEGCPVDYHGQNHLEWSKLIAEKYVEFYARKKGFRSCIFRLSTIYAPNSLANEPNFVGGYAEAINQGETIRLPLNGVPRRDLLHVGDFILACQSFIESEVNQGLYNLGGGQDYSLSLIELVNKMEAISGYQATIDTDNPLPAPIPLNYVSDISKIEHELGWRPTINLDEGLKTIL